MYGKIIIAVRPAKLPKAGHQQHQTGAGKHADRRLKRLKTREAQRRQAIGETS